MSVLRYRCIYDNQFYEYLKDHEQFGKQIPVKL